MELRRGMRVKLDQYANLNSSLEVEMQIHGPSMYDFCCFGVDAQNKLSDDRYMIFYNQISSPQGEIMYRNSGNTANFSLNLSRLPSSIQKLVFTVSIDGNSTMRTIQDHMFTLKQNGHSLLHLQLYGSDFQQEKAIITVEIYRKDAIWRINAIARGFDGGLGNLLRAYGGEEEQTRSVEPVAPTTKQKVSLEKKLEKAPKLVSLAKPIQIQLEKRNLQEVVARVALVMDISGSMNWQYENGTVQEIVNHILPLAVQFDDDGELDFWYYGECPKKMPSVSLKNYENAISKKWKSVQAQVSGWNNEPAVIKEVLSEYEGTKLPVYVIFITDGGVAQANKIKKLMIEASHFPIFWQFVGVGGHNYGILEQLDTLHGRYVDNANFFALDDFRSISDAELYERLLQEFPNWLQEVRSKGMVS